MANRTDKEAYAIHGTNPQNLVEYIIRQKIYQTLYWKESCFALTAESLIDKAVELKAAGGTYGGARKPTNFMCLILKMLQIQPDKEIIAEYIRNEDFKYVRLLGAFYMRLVARPLEVYQYLEPLYNDYRKVRIMTLEGRYVLSHIDEVVDEMLHKDFLFDIALPRLPARHVMEKTGQLEPRISVLDEDFDDAAVQEEAAAAAAQEAAAVGELREAANNNNNNDARHDRDRDDDRHDHDRDRDDRDRDYDRDRDRGGADDYRSGDRKKEKWQLSREERREQARRRSPSPHDRYADRDRGYDRDRDRGRRDDEGPSRRRDDRDYDDRDRRRDDRDRDGRRDRDDRDDGRSGRDRDRGYDRRRGSSRSRSRDRGGGGRERGDRERDSRRSRSRSPGRKPDRASERDRGARERDSKAGGGGGGGGGGSSRAPDADDPEIAEQNALRAKLGLKPLK